MTRIIGAEAIDAGAVPADEHARARATGGDKVLRWFEVDVTTKSGERIAQVRKQLYVRLKPQVRPAGSGSPPAPPQADP